MIRRPPRSTLSSSSAASDVYKRQAPRKPVDHSRNIKATRRGPEWLRHADVLGRPAGLALTSPTSLQPQSRRAGEVQALQHGNVCYWHLPDRQRAVRIDPRRTTADQERHYLLSADWP